MRFADLLVKELKEKRNVLERVIWEPEERAYFYGKLLEKHWFTIPSTKFLKVPRIYAVDSSDGIIELAGGGVIHIVRAAALSNSGEKVRKLHLDSFYPRSNEGLVEYRKLMREKLEHEVALSVAKKLDEEDIILIDGSLLGRMLHVFNPLDVPGRGDVIVDYVNVFSSFLSACLQRNITLVGVAKDSKSSILREALLIELLLYTTKGYDQSLRKELENLVVQVYKNPRQTIGKVASLSSRIDGSIVRIFEELLDPTPDYKIIMATGLGKGYSHPLRLELRYFRENFIKAIFTPKKKLELVENFLNKLPSRGKIIQNVDAIYRAVEEIASYPPVASFYVRFRANDIPLRIDVVHPSIEKWSTDHLPPFVRKGWEQVVERVLKVLEQLYAGLKNYNILLKKVDEYVRFTKIHRDNYKRIIESLLGKLIEQSRGMRRVSFP